MKTRHLLLILVLFTASPAFSKIVSEVVIEGRVSQINSNAIVVYSQGQLIEVPKTLVKGAQDFKAGKPFYLEMPFEQAKTLVRRDVPVEKEAKK